MTGHERIEELLALDALDALDGDDRQELARALAEHGPDCQDCASLRAEFGETAGLLAFALDPVPVSPDLQERTVNTVIGERPTAPIRRRSPLRTVGVAAVIVCLVVAGAFAGYRAGVEGGGPSATLAAFLSRPDVRLVQFEGSGGDVAMAVTSDGSESYLLGTDLAPLPPNKVYELWSIAGTTPTSAACVVPDQGSIVEHLGANLAGAQVMAVTVEDASCPSAPTTTPILTASLA